MSDDTSRTGTSATDAPSAEDGDVPVAAAPLPVSRSRRILIALAAIVVLLAVSVGGLTLFWDRGEPGGLTLVITEGSAARLEYPTVDSAIDVPTDLVFERGEVLVIRNEDTAANRAGPWVLAGGETLRMRFDTPGEYFYLCAVDEAESVTVMVVENWD